METFTTYPFWKLTLGVIATLGLYSVLYRETKFFRLFEHIFLGLAAGYTLFALWSETVHPLWYSKMIGSAAEASQVSNPGYWPYVFLLPIGFMAYFVFSERHNWMSRVPIGIILGLWAGQQVQVWWNRFGPQIGSSIKPVIPTAYDSFVFPGTNNVFLPGTTTPDTAAIERINSSLYASQAINNLIFIVTLICVMSYFIFSFDLKNRFLIGMTVWGRWLLMIGFGAIFGSTVMTRFALMIDRMYFIWIEWFRDSLIRGISGG